MSNVEPYPYTSGGFDSGAIGESYGPPDAGDLASVTNPATQPTDAQQANAFPPYVIQSSVRIAQMARTRMGDVPATFSCRVIVDGAKWRFELPVEKIDTNLQVVLTDGTTNTTTTPVLNQDYTVDYRRGVISFTNTPSAGLALVVQGTYYKDFLPGELQAYVRTAFLMHTQTYDPNPSLDTTWPVPAPPTYSNGVYGVPPQPQLDEIEEYPLSLLVASLCLWDVAISISQDIDVRTPDGVTISRAQRYQQVMSMIKAVDAQYEKLSNILQVGMFRITMTTLRRVSRTTNRFVPVFRAQEYDDLSWRQREMPPIDKTIGGGRTITDVGNYVAGQAYPADVIVAQNGTRYISIQPVPATGPTPLVDVNPATNNGFYWAVTNINAANWYGVWW